MAAAANGPRALVRDIVRRGVRPALRGPGSSVDALRERVDRLDEALQRVSHDELAVLAARVDELGPLRDSVDERIAVQDRARAEIIQALERLRRHIVDAEKQLTEVVGELGRSHALPYLAGDPFETFDVAGAGNVIGFQAADDETQDGYVAFEDVFRGSEARVRALQEPYVPIIGDRRPVADLGCGRGEFLDALRDHGIPAVGVDADAGMVARTRAKGHDVEQADAVSYLRSVGDGELGAVFSAQVVEHIPYDALERLIAESRRALQPGGLFIAETVNPHSPDALKSFWLDPTHQHPLFPEALLILCRSAGFRSGYVFHPGGSGNAEQDRFRLPAYAVVAAAP